MTLFAVTGALVLSGGGGGPKSLLSRHGTWSCNRSLDRFHHLVISPPISIPSPVNSPGDIPVNRATEEEECDKSGALGEFNVSRGGLSGLSGSSLCRYISSACLDSAESVCASSAPFGAPSLFLNDYRPFISALLSSAKWSSISPGGCFDRMG